MSLSAFRTVGMQANAFADTGTLGGGFVEFSRTDHTGVYPDDHSRDAWPVVSDEVGGAAPPVTMRHIRVLCI